MNKLNKRKETNQDILRHNTTFIIQLIKENLDNFTFEELQEIDMLAWSESLEREPGDSI